MNLMYMLMYMMMHESHVSLLMCCLGRNRWTDAPIDGIDVQSAQHTGEPARCWLRCLRCLAQMLGQMLAIEMPVIEIECSEQQMSADDAGRCCGLGRCYWQMLADDAGLADVAGRMVRA